VGARWLLPPDEQELVSHGLQIGIVVEVGTTVQFQVRDAVGADKDLRLAV
jgi:small ligand-binding sensory domain FIST